MKARYVLVLAMIMVMLVAGSTQVAADGAVVPFKAVYVMSPQPLGINPDTGCQMQKLPGVGQATHLGLSTWYSDAEVCLDPTTMIGTQSGTSVFTAANGDRLTGEFAGDAYIIMEPGLGPVAHFTGSVWATEGTGRFEGASLAGTYSGTAILAQGTGILYFDGTLTKAEKPRP